MSRKRSATGGEWSADLDHVGAGDCELEAENAHAIHTLERIDLAPAESALKLARKVDR